MHTFLNLVCVTLRYHNTDHTELVRCTERQFVVKVPKLNSTYCKVKPDAGTKKTKLCDTGVSCKQK